MKKIKTSIFLIAVFALVPFVSASAQVDEQQQVESVETTETTILEDKVTGRAERLESYKAKVSAKLAEAQSKRIIARCKTAQVKITAYRKTATTVVENRTKVYMGIGEKLDNLLAKMQKAELNTQALETAREDMQSDLVAIKESFDSYDTALADLEAMDCVSDPESFNATLLEARNLQATLKTKTQEFRQFSTSQIKEILQDLRTQLQNKVEQP